MGARFGIRRDGDTAVTLLVAGEVDGAEAPAMIGAFRAALEGEAPEKTRVDLARVSFLDSMGVAALLACRRAALDAGRTFVVINATGLTARILSIAGVCGLLGLPRTEGVPTGF